ncbi:DUF218 domain-containing protein [Rutstroemia sp. NJR-2017a BVV2]|nr:DUF218 domain-containing protein [Rutstroemia sp. NJR-2017a BVV2]
MSSPPLPNSNPLPTHLILVPCHAIYTGPPQAPPHECSLPSNWLLQPFQTEEQHTFIQHIQHSISLLRQENPLSNAILIFSGGTTHPLSPHNLSEARSYYHAALSLDLLSPSELVENSEARPKTGSVLLEQSALDSYQNLLHSILLFQQHTGVWPQRITIVGFAFKSARMEGLHARALGLEGRVRVEGIDPGYMNSGSGEWDQDRAESTREGERRGGYEVWRGDMRGVGRGLRGKRDARDWGVGGWRDREEEGKEGKKRRVRERGLFGSEEERRRSGVRTKWVEYVSECPREDWAGYEVLVREEVLLEGVEQPWEKI